MSCLRRAARSEYGALTCMVTFLSSISISLVKKSAPMVALYSLENLRCTYWFMRDVFPTLCDTMGKVRREKVPNTMTSKPMPEGFSGGPSVVNIWLFKPTTSQSHPLSPRMMTFRRRRVFDDILPSTVMNISQSCQIMIFAPCAAHEVPSLGKNVRKE